MKAAFINRTGPPEEIVVADLPVPVPGPGEVLIRVEAASVNPIDTYVRSGAVPADLQFPRILGSDFAGVVEAVGEGGAIFGPGDRVWGAGRGVPARQGSFAERITADAKWVYPIPEGITSEVAAATALTGLTAWLGLADRARLRSGETILVQGGSGGVGSMVVQMARAIGARTLATAGTEAKKRLCMESGADVAIGYREPDFAEKIAEASPGGVDCWWESGREPDFDLIVRSLATFGRVVILAGRDARPPFPVGPFYVKAATILGHILFPYGPESMGKAAAEINRLLARGQLKPRIDRVLPLEQVAEAHRVQWRSTVERSGELAGKIVIRIT